MTSIRESLSKPERINEIAKAMPCACGLQKAGSNKQEIIGKVETIAIEATEDPSETSTTTLITSCNMRCLKCSHVHQWRETNRVSKELPY